MARGWRSREAHRLVAVLGALLLVLTGVVGVVGALSVSSVERDLRLLLEDDGRVLSELRAVDLLVVQAQLALEQALAPDTTTSERLAAFDAALEEVVDRWAAAQEDGHPAAPDEVLFDTWLIAVSELRAELETGAEPVAARARSAFEELATAFDDGLVPLAEQVRTLGDGAASRAGLARAVLLVVAVLGVVVGGAVSRSGYLAARAQHRAIVQRDEDRRRETDHARVEARVARTFDQARSEAVVLEAGELALSQLCPDRASELLLADSSRAHVEVVARTHREEDLPGCGVPTPADCPAVARGHTLEFVTSEAFDACSYLRGRPQGPVSAVCLPVSISGAAEGVLHSTGVDGVPVDADDRHRLEVVGRRLGERLGALRTFEQSQLRATTDPLTGLINRRAFEDAVAPRLRSGRDVAIAYGDIDHFKALNDTFGHETGDRVLRTFATFVRELVRPSDVVCRWGGEEFVIAFPDLDTVTATEILERLRRELIVLTAGGTVPHFTVSFGVADRRDADTIEDLIGAADRALLAAKRAGRDRIVVSGEATSQPRPS